MLTNFKTGGIIKSEKRKERKIKMYVYYFENNILYSVIRYTKAQLKKMESEYGKFIKMKNNA